MDLLRLSLLSRMMLYCLQRGLTVYFFSVLFVSCCFSPLTHTSYGFILVCAAVYTAPQQAHVSSALNANCVELFTLKVWIMIDAFLNSSVVSCPSLV